MEKILAIVANRHLSSEDVSLLRTLADRGARVVAWQHPPIVQERFPNPDIARALSELGIDNATLSQAIGEDGSLAVDEAVIAWMKSFGKTPLAPEGSFRSLFRFRQLSLWWWAELFLYHDTPLRLFVRDIEALTRLLEEEKPDRVILLGTVRELDDVAKRLHSRVERHGRAARFPSQPSRASLRFLSALVKTMGTGLKSMLRPAPARDARRRFLFLTHASMWRRSRVDDSADTELVEMYLGQILKALDPQGEETRVVAVGPAVPFRQRSLTAVLRDVMELDEHGRPFVPIRRYLSLRLSLAAAKDSLACWRMWRRFRELTFLDQALRHRGIPLPRQALSSFRDTFLLQIPWAIRSYREVEALLRNESPSLLVLYAEYSGLGRAAVAAAAEASVPSFAVQHGILYPRLYANEHSPDEVGSALDGVDSVPIPTRTAVFGSLARDLLLERGHYPPERIVITGSPKFDALVEAGRHFDREKTRRRLDVAPDVPMLVVASRFTAIGSVFEDLVRASEAVDDLWLLVKPHQAERPDLYERIGARAHASRLRILPPQENLLELLFASDGLITVDSFASSEALVLGRPVMVVNLPSNLSALVERGVAIGVSIGEAIEPVLRNFLHDRKTRGELERQRKKYLEEFAYGADGKSTARIVSAIRQAASGR